MKKLFLTILALLVFSTGTLAALDSADYIGGWYGLNAAQAVLYGYTSTGMFDLIGGARFDNVTSASILKISESSIVLDGDVSTTGTFTGYVIGTNVQAWDAQLDDIAALIQTDSYIIVGDGTNWVEETGATARTSLGLAIGTDVQAHSAPLDAITTAQAAATNEGLLFISSYNIVYTQTGSAVTVCTIPANAYVTEVKVMTTTAFNDSGTVTCDIGWSGTLEGYAGDLDIKAADGWAYADVYTGFGVSVGGTARDILVSIAAQNSDGTAGAATVYIEWTMGAPGSL